MIMESIILWASVLLAAYWTFSWFRFRKLSIGHLAQIICAVFLWAVVAYFILHPEISRLHMLWVIPVAFVASSIASIPYTRSRAAALKRKHRLE